MKEIFKNGIPIKENRNQYKNILFKMKNSDFITSVGCIISFSNKKCNESLKNFKIITRFYKIYSFKNDISFEFIYKVLTKIFPYEIVQKIIYYYIKNDVSFKSIKQDEKNNNTLKFISNINNL